MDASTCPRCRSTRYRNPALRLMVNVCGHTLCELCVELLFLKGVGTCPQCRVPLRRVNFRVQCFEDPSVEKEIDIRKRILRDYNKSEDDFESLDEYNNYLEEIETIVYNLCNNIDIVETNKRIDQYKRDNRDAIQRNRNRLARPLQELEEMVEMERIQEEQRRKELLDFEKQNKKKKSRDHEALINELMNSEEDAEKIVSKFVEREKELNEELKKLPPLKPVTQFSTGIKFGQQGSQPYLPLPKYEDAPLYKHETPHLRMEGPEPPNLDDIQTHGFMNHIRSESIIEKAGGFCATYACQRALQEAMQGLYHCTKPFI